jgi:hypothetical protein
MDRLKDAILQIARETGVKLTVELYRGSRGMSLTDEDIDQLRDTVVEAIQSAVMPHLKILATDLAETKSSLIQLVVRIEALGADVKELYRMIAVTARGSSEDKKLARRCIEQKVLQLYEDVKLLAREAGVTLPT